jgi:6-pyruvoyltetrahydropterin/6-carboxytetrahydropterin synthase
MERWAIELEKEYFKFSAAHFLIFPDGSAERLHGHNYRVFVEIDAELTRYGLVIDFKTIKPVVREICDRLDEHWIIPGEHPVLRCGTRADGITEVRYLDRYYAAPSADVLVLPINNTSSENLATFFGRELLRMLEERFEDVRVSSVRVAVEETSGQRGVYRYESEGKRSRPS